MAPGTLAPVVSTSPAEQPLIFGDEGRGPEREGARLAFNGVVPQWLRASDDASCRPRVHAGTDGVIGDVGGQVVADPELKWRGRVQTAEYVLAFQRCGIRPPRTAGRSEEQTGGTVNYNWRCGPAVEVKRGRHAAERHRLGKDSPPGTTEALTPFPADRQRNQHRLN